MNNNEHSHDNNNEYAMTMINIEHDNNNEHSHDKNNKYVNIKI